jgi:hypothetical protein
VRFLRLVILLAGTLGFCGAGALRAQPEFAREYQVKALFIFNFLQFVEWPLQAYGSADAPLRVAVLGESPFGGALTETVRGEQIRNRVVEVVHATRVEEVLHCQVIFVSRTERANLGHILGVTSSRPILTIGDMPDFARRGGIINFYMEQQKVRFEVNRAAAQQSGLKLASQLLGLARIVGPNSSEGQGH